MTNKQQRNYPATTVAQLIVMLQALPQDLPVHNDEDLRLGLIPPEVVNLRGYTRVEI